MRFSGRTPPSLQENSISVARRKHGAPRFDLTTTNPTESGLTAGNEELAAAISSGEFASYEPDASGRQTAREAICAMYARKETALNPDQAFLTASTSEAYSV